MCVHHSVEQEQQVPTTGIWETFERAAEQGVLSMRNLFGMWHFTRGQEKWQLY